MWYILFKRITFLKISMSLLRKWNFTRARTLQYKTRATFKSLNSSTHTHVHTHAPPVCAPLNQPCPHRRSRIFCEASFLPGSTHQRGYPTVSEESSWCSLALGTHADTRSLAQGPCLFSCLLIFGKLNSVENLQVTTSLAEAAGMKIMSVESLKVLQCAWSI